MQGQNKSGITLKGITWDHPRGYAPLEACETVFRRNTGCHIKWERRSLKDFGDQSIEELAGNYDLLVIDHPHVGAAVQARCLLPLDDVLPESVLKEFEEASVGPNFRSYHFDRHQWALPVDAACQVASYKKSGFEHALPKTWEEVWELSELLRTKNQWIGAALCPTDCSCSFLTLTSQLESPPTEDPLDFSSPGVAREALTMLMQLQHISHPESLNLNPVQLYEKMLSGREIVYCPLAFGYINYSVPSNNNSLDFTSIPGRTGALLGGAGIAVSAACQHPDVAMEYLAWVCSAGIQRTLYLENAGQPAHLSVWKSKDCDAFSGGFFSGTLNTIRNAHVRPRHAGWPGFQEALGQCIHMYLRGIGDLVSTTQTIYRLYQGAFSK